MNRIEIKYTTQKDSVCSNLKIFNDIKGLTYEQVGTTFYGKEADVMLEYFRNSTIEENEKVMLYGIYVDGKREMKNRE